MALDCTVEGTNKSTPSFGINGRSIMHGEMTSLKDSVQPEVTHAGKNEHIER